MESHKFGELLNMELWYWIRNYSIEFRTELESHNYIYKSGL